MSREYDSDPDAVVDRPVESTDDGNGANGGT